MALDEWSIREQLCLASAVLVTKDKDWTSVSSKMKLLCGNNRPMDWFSNNSCATQYAELLETIASKTRVAKDIAADIDMEKSHDNSAESVNDLIIKELTEARMQELKDEIRKEQEEYAKINNNLKIIQNGQLKDEEIIEMWKAMQKEEEMQRIEEMKLENKLREWEQRNRDMQLNWRATVRSAEVSPNCEATSKEERNLCLKDIIGTSKIIQGIDPQQQSISPLLSSLLKSPTPSVSSPILNTTAHVTSPTITTLLTGGAINQNQPAITLKSTIAASEAANLLTRPISGPPMESMSVLANASQNVLSPSQSAPTLSMLLEKNKVSNIVISAASAAYEDPAKVNEISCSVSDSNNEEVPMDIEEDVVTAVVSAVTDLVGVDDSDADANEEQQLLEVFKNLGNIDDLEDIDVAAVINEEVDFLKSADEPADAVEETLNEQSDSNLIKNLPKNGDVAYKADVSEVDDKDVSSIKEVNDDVTDEQKEATIIKTASSDDSNDDIPLSTLGSNTLLSNKEILVEVQGESLNTNTNEHLDGAENQSECKNEDLRPSEEDLITAIANDSEELEEEALESENPKDADPTNVSTQKSPRSDNSDIIIIPTDDESNGDGKREQIEQTSEDESQQHELTDNIGVNDEDNEGDEIDKEKDIQPSADVENVDESTHSATKESEMETQAPTTSFVDTDDDSTQTIAVSDSAHTDDKITEILSLKSTNDSDEVKNIDRKLDDEKGTARKSAAKAPVVKRLRIHCRSESPIANLDDDTTASDHSVNQRSRRQNSSTPIIDSVPNSPTLSDRDDRDIKSSKKSLLSLYNSVMSSKNAALFQRTYSEQSSKIKELCKCNTDFEIIKKNIETGITRNVCDLQRDFLLCCQNGIMVFESNSASYKIVCDFKQRCQNVKGFITYEKSAVKVRGSSRKSKRKTSN